MADIRVTHLRGDEYAVEVAESSGSSNHVVTVASDELERYGGGAAPGDLLAASFEFLLEREPKEAILGRFRLSTIERYFPEYAEEIRRRLG